MTSLINPIARRKPVRQLAAILALSTLPLAVIGCGIAGSGAGDAAGIPVAAHTTVGGAVHGGQQPVSGGDVKMWTVGTGGNGSVSTSLMNSTVTTASDGTFTVTGKYTCPAGNPAALTYLTATGGNPGLTAGTNNSKIVMIAALGACNTLLANFPFISVDEITTVASVYALGSFMADSTHIGASSTNATGIANAFLIANTLANIATGTSPSLNIPATASAPVNEINTIADLISPCVNSVGTDSNCASLISLTTAGGITPADTAGAVLSMVKNPANQVTALYNLTPSTPPFQPTLGGAPKDWTVAVKITGADINAPSGIAIDASGNAWVANTGGTSISEIKTTGAILSPTQGYTASGLLGPQALAIDTTGAVWIANSYGSNVIKMTVSGGVATGTSYTAGGIASPSAIAVDTSNNVYITNYTGATVSAITSAGTAVSGSPFTLGGTLAQPDGIALDASGNIWVSSSGSGLVAEMNSSGTALSGSGYTDGAILAPAGLAIDGLGNTYVASTGINAVSIFGSTGTPAASSPVATSFQLPAGVVTDGANKAWVTNGQTAGSLSMLTSPTATPVALGSLNLPGGVAVDASGNVWTANAGDNSVTQFVGLATAAKTPLANHFTAP